MSRKATGVLQAGLQELHDRAMPRLCTIVRQSFMRVCMDTHIYGMCLQEPHDRPCTSVRHTFLCMCMYVCMYVCILQEARDKASPRHFTTVTYSFWRTRFVVHAHLNTCVHAYTDSYGHCQNISYSSNKHTHGNKFSHITILRRAARLCVYTCMYTYTYTCKHTHTHTNI